MEQKDRGGSGQYKEKCLFAVLPKAGMEIIQCLTQRHLIFFW